MKAEKMYLLPENIARKVGSGGFLRTLLMAGMLLLTMPVMAQYYNVSHSAGTATIGGVNVTVSNVNGAIATNCGYGPYKEGNGGPGSYTFAFSSPIVAVRFHVTAIGPLDNVSVMINGSSYVLSASEVNPLPAPCSGNTAVVSGGSIVSGGGFNADATVDINPGFGINDITITSGGASGVVASDFNFEPVLNLVPSFVFGSSVPFSVCQDAAATDLSGLLSINDADNGQTEMWTITSAPANGTLGGFPNSMTSTGSTVTPSGFTYQPNASFNGADSFIVRIDDGTDTADIMVHVTVNPTPDVTVSSSQSKCNGAATDSIYFTGTVPGTSFDWLNDDNTTGIALNGNGDIPSFTATNGSFVPVVSTLTVTPTANTCVGPSKLYTLTVNPTPDVMVPGDLAACNNTSVIVTPNFSSNVSGTTYTWVNTNSAIGLATTGTGDILSFTGTNPGIEDSFGTITVTPWANSCIGTPQSFNITIHPTPMLTSELNNNMSCDNGTFNYTPTSATSGTTYMWDRAAVGGITNGAGSGTGAISEVLDNNTTGLVTVTYVFTVTANGCDNVQNVADTVVPTLALTSTLTPDSICNNTTFSYTPTSATPGVTFQWNRNPITGISNPGATNSFNPLESLNDTTALPVVVTYNYHTIYGICTSVQEDVMVQVNPSAKLTTPLTPSAICDSTLFTYGGASATPGVVYSWSRATVSGIVNAAASGVDTIKEVLINHNTYPTQVTYADTLTAYGCQNVEFVKVYVNPKPVLSSAHNANPVCSKAPFNYVPSSATLTTTFAWSRAAVAGISNAAGHDTGSIHETLTNTTKLPVTVLYIDTLTVNGCKNTDSIFLVVNPLPRLSSKDTAAICNKETFNYLPASVTPGSSFDWSRGFVLGIDAIAGSGPDNPNEQLINTTNFNVTVTYVYTVTANNCNTTDDTVRVIVHPTPRLSSEDTVAACSKMPFNYKPSSLTPLVTYTWSRAKVNGILPTTGTGTGDINETLTDTAIFAINTFYKYKLTVEGCVDSQNVMVVVNPAPYSPVIGIMPPSSLCSGTQYQNFGATTLPATGSTYIWSAINASVMATGNTKQNALVTFSNAGDAKVIVTSSIGSTGCRIADTFAVTVTTAVAQTPKVIYYNGQFMCLQSSAGTTYQWGYDDALSLDSTLIQGEVNQTYFISSPDLTYRYFWVMTTNGGCTQKTYYNVPMGVTNVNTEASSVKVYPNPANANINVEVNTLISGDIQVEVMNLLGQKVSTAAATDRKATINVSGLASGCYLVNCYSEGVKIATAKFIKN